MAVSDDRKFKREQVLEILTRAIGKTLGEVDTSKQFDRTIGKPKITGIAGDVIEQSVFGYKRDAKQECDIEIDGILTELKTTGVRIPKSELKKVQGKTGDSYNSHLTAKEGITITGVTLSPTIQTEFLTSSRRFAKFRDPLSTRNKSVSGCVILRPLMVSNVWRTRP